MSNTDFMTKLLAFTRDTKLSLTQLRRVVVMNIATELVERSPVGNAELWAINDSTRDNRITYNLFLGEAGQRQLSNRSLARMFPTRGPRGYVGGRFRGNWQYGENTPPSGELDTIDPSGGVSVARFASVTTTMEGGAVDYIVNNLPYAQRLENGWSKQAPAGMVALTVQRFSAIVNEAAARVNTR